VLRVKLITPGIKFVNEQNCFEIIGGKNIAKEFKSRLFYSLGISFVTE
jgi:hypothetical protein